MDEENLRRRIRALLEEIQIEADPFLLRRCLSIFRKEVPFFRRSLTAVWLLLLEQGEKGKTEHGAQRRFQRSGKEKDTSSKAQKNTDEETNSIPEEESTRLFINIGRNRRVFPREILGLLGARAQINRSDIGDIRILDNYSFVQVRTAVADTAINALNGTSFRGRTLAVNYARSKKEESEYAETKSN